MQNHTALKHTVRTTLAALALGVAPLAAHAATPLTLFGVKLHSADRATLRAAVKKAGLAPERVDSRYYCDKYGVNGQLKGAKTLYLCYTAHHNRFAYAQYVFPAFMDTGLVSRVINMVSVKYGQPDSEQGSTDLGSVKALWHEGHGMRVTVSRGWPDTTTYLELTNIANKHRMRAQIQAQKQRQQRQQAQQQANAF